jgi:transcription antitermination factor NusG
LYTRPRHERKIVTEINSLKRYECYLPVRQVVKKFSDHVRMLEEPLFNNYVFVKTTAQNRVVLFDVPGVLRFVAFEGKAVTISDIEIDRIRLIENNGIDVRSEPYCTTGSQVVIKHGVFAGMQGILVKKLNNSRLIVRMPLLKQAISLDLSEHDLLFV